MRTIGFLFICSSVLFIHFALNYFSSAPVNIYASIGVSTVVYLLGFYGVLLVSNSFNKKDNSNSSIDFIGRN